MSFGGHQANGPIFNKQGSQALLPTPPSIQMPVPMSAVPPPLMPGMIPVALIGSAAPVSFIATSSAPMMVASGNSTNNSRHHKIKRTKSSQERQEPKYEPPPEAGSTTTVFVGNITEHASDSLTRQILMKCGPISSWKRVQGASGKLQAFGFCEYISPGAGLRSMRLLNGFQLGDKTLLVKVDSKTRAQLDAYKQRIKEEHERTNHTDDYDVELDDDTKDADEDCLEEIKRLITGNSNALAGTYEDALPYMKRSHSGCADNLEGMDMDNAKKDLVSKEIRSFRQAYRNDEEPSKKDKEREKDRDRGDRDRERERERDRERERRREREERDREKEFDRRRERKRDDWSDEERRVKRGTPPVREREEEKRPRRSRSRSRERTSRDDEEEGEYEKRRLERVKREKEKAYQERLKEFEARERKKMREYEKQMVKDEKSKDNEAEERIQLREFLEDYDDDRDDSKYYVGSSFRSRIRDREMELESDNKDKQREMEEIDEILRKRLSEPPTEKENESPNQTRIKQERSPEIAQPTRMKPTFSVIKSKAESSPQDAMPSSNFSVVRSPPVAKRERDVDDNADHSQKKTAFGFGLKTLTVSQQSSRKLESVFNAGEEEQANDNASKKKLVKIETEEDEEKKKAATADEKKKIIRNLIEKIPTAKDELFQFPVKMDMIDQNLVEKRIKPWVNKKIFEYIGEQEPTLVEFICSKVISKSMPKNILEDVAMVLDEEAEVFVVKMWRLLIYETEAKHLGLVK